MSFKRYCCKHCLSLAQIKVRRSATYCSVRPIEPTKYDRYGLVTHVLSGISKNMCWDSHGVRGWPINICNRQGIWPVTMGEGRCVRKATDPRRGTITQGPLLPNITSLLTTIMSFLATVTLAGQRQLWRAWRCALRVIRTVLRCVSCCCVRPCHAFFRVTAVT